MYMLGYAYSARDVNLVISTVCADCMRIENIFYLSELLERNSPDTEQDKTFECASVEHLCLHTLSNGVHFESLCICVQLSKLKYALGIKYTSVCTLGYAYSAYDVNFCISIFYTYCMCTAKFITHSLYVQIAHAP